MRTWTAMYLSIPAYREYVWNTGGVPICLSSVWNTEYIYIHVVGCICNGLYDLQVWYQEKTEREFGQRTPPLSQEAPQWWQPGNDTTHYTGTFVVCSCDSRSSVTVISQTVLLHSMARSSEMQVHMYIHVHVYLLGKACTLAEEKGNPPHQPIQDIPHTQEWNIGCPALRTGGPGGVQRCSVKLFSQHIFLLVVLLNNQNNEATGTMGPIGYHPPSRDWSQLLCTPHGGWPRQLMNCVNKGGKHPAPQMQFVTIHTLNLLIHACLGWAMVSPLPAFLGESHRKRHAQVNTCTHFSLKMTVLGELH